MEKYSSFSALPTIVNCMKLNSSKDCLLTVKSQCNNSFTFIKDMQLTEFENAIVEIPKIEITNEEFVISQSNVQEILHALAEGADVLVDNAILAFLGNLQPNEQVVIKLDLLFSVLGIRTEDEVINLIKCFRKHQVKLSDVTKIVKYENELTIKGKATTWQDSLGSKALITSKALQTTSLAKGSSQQDNMNIIFKVLVDFLGERQRKEFQENKVSTEGSDNIMWTNEVIREYWNQYLGILTGEEEQIWTNLLQGLQKHRITVTDRALLKRDNLKLKIHNQELTSIFVKMVCTK